MKRRWIDPLRWLVPGLGVKRWLMVALIGILLLLDAVDRYIVAEGFRLHVNEVLDSAVADYFPPSFLTDIFGIIGIALVLTSAWMWTRALLRASRSLGQHGLMDTIRGARLRDGYKIVAVGGGTGLSTLLRGLKRSTSNLTAIVTVSDDGGSSGRLQKELGVLPPGDVRNCLVALADDEALVTELFRFRFEEGEGLSGHSFGNLFLAAMTGITGNFDRAIKESSRVLNVVGRVLPATLGVVRLCATLRDGTTVEGESKIGSPHAPIERLYFDPPYAAALDETIAAIRDADAIVLGPGSLFTSILPNLLVDRIAQEIAAAPGLKLYVCNVMTQPGETDAMTAADHVEALLAHAGTHVCDYVLVNSAPPQRLRELYAEEGQTPVAPDVARIEALGMTVVQAQMISETQTVRHDSQRLADNVIGIIDRAVAERASFVRPATYYSHAAGAPSRKPTVRSTPP